MCAGAYGILNCCIAAVLSLFSCTSTASPPLGRWSMAEIDGGCFVILIAMMAGDETTKACEVLLGSDIVLFFSVVSSPVEDAVNGPATTASNRSL